MNRQPAILITGASRGFGHALVEVYSQRGWTLFPLVRDAQAVRQLQLLGDRIHPILADVSCEQVESAISQVLYQHCDALDLLINNAGQIKKRRWLADTTPEDLLDLFNVHCAGAFRCTRAALPSLIRAPRPAIVNISSRWGSIQRTAAGSGGGIYSYQIAKCAQNMLTACLDQELKAKGVRVFAVHPGRLKTEAAAPDANVEPIEAARALANWLEQVDEETVCGFHDLIGEGILEW